MPGLSRAQETRPNITPEAKTPPKKNNNGPRALALLQMSSDGKVTLVPIMIKVDGKFYDASSYKANPVPMALDGGTVYEGMRSGSSLGLFTVNSALHSLAQNVQDPWIGTGLWLPTGSEAPKQGRRAEDAPVGLETKDEPPRLKKSGGAGGSEKKADSTAGNSSPATAPAGSAPAAPVAPADSSTKDSKPGTQSSAPPTASSPASASTASGSSTPSADQSKDAAGKDGSGKEGEKPASASASSDRPRNADEARPRLRRGKPIDVSADYDVPGYGKLGASAKGTATGLVRRTIDLVPAISDAGGPDPHTYKFEWLKGEEEDRRKQLIDFAKKQVQAYVEELAKNKISATPSPGKAPVKKSAAKTPEPILENIQLRAFDVWTNNQPVMILMADAHMPQPGEKAGAAVAPPPGADASAVPPIQYSITLVARTDIYNNLHKLYSGVTDRFHLDITPKLELIDAVDADGDGRGELLFHKITDAGTGYAIYRPTADTLWKMFDTLNP